VKDLSELALKKFDVDHDGKISFRDYETAVIEEPLLLEAFGQCLPTDESCGDFLVTLQSWKYTQIIVDVLHNKRSFNKRYF